MASSCNSALETSEGRRQGEVQPHQDTTAGRSNEVKNRYKGKGKVIKKKNVKKRIKQLEKRLKALHSMIMKFQESELSLDEMDEEDSPYVRTDYIMQKFVRDWETLCSLTGTSPHILVDTSDTPKPYDGTPYRVINKKVQRMVDSDEFPDFQDVVDLIAHCKTKYVLPISEEETTRLAKIVFADVGKMIKKLRRCDFLHHFGCHLTDAVRMEEDPSLNDHSLQSTLQKSSEDAQTKLLSLLDDFASRQVTREQEGIKEDEEEGDENDEDDDGDDEMQKRDEDDDGDDEMQKRDEDDDGDDEMQKRDEDDDGDDEMQKLDVNEDGDSGDDDGENDDRGDFNNCDEDSIEDDDDSNDKVEEEECMNDSEQDDGDGNISPEDTDTLHALESGESVEWCVSKGKSVSVSDDLLTGSDSEDSFSQFIDDVTPRNGFDGPSNSSSPTDPTRAHSSEPVPRESTTEDDITIVLTDDTSSPPDTPPCKRYKLDDNDIIILDEDDDQDQN